MGKILGKFVGKCCDADVVNNNGMYLSRELFDNLIASDDYKTAIKNKYYIGFLGHPEDPNCMDFRNACVVMTDMKMESNGDITGSFDLVDTPVGRVVKSFVDAGVNFGISIRGAGDVAADGTVDPETFVFRGFDLVTFPAYNDCVPEFKAIAASTDADQQKKYRKVCNAVKRNLASINSCEAIEVLQDQFNENSKEYQMLADRVEEIQNQEDKDLYVQVLEQKVQGLTKAYMEKVKECHDRKHQVSIMNDQVEKFKRDCDKAERAARIACSQSVKASKQIKKLSSENKSLSSRVTASSKSVKAALSRASKVESKLANSEKENKRLVEASERTSKQYEELKSKHNSIVRTNLLSDKKIEASESLVKDKEKSIKDLERRLGETVAENEKLKAKVSNREAEFDDLASKLEACENLLLEYQQAYADSCAYAVGTHLENVPVTSTTTMDELKSYIYSMASVGSRRQPVVESDFEEMEEDDQGPVTV